MSITYADRVAISRAVWVKALETIDAAGLLRLIVAVSAAKSSGANSGTEVFRGVGDTKNRVMADVDVAGNRTSIGIDAS